MATSYINYISYGQQAGYAVASVNYLMHLIKTRATFDWNTVLQDNTLKFGIESDFFEDLPLGLKEKVNPGARTNSYTHQILHTTPEHFPSLVNDKMQNIGMTVWETDTLPDTWRGYLKQLDKIIVPCSWNAEVFKQAGVNIPLYTLPHISQFHGEECACDFLGIPDSSFVFLNVSVWESRKNLVQLIEAYFKAFDKKEDVVLVLKTSKRDMTSPSHTFRGKKKYVKTKNRLRILNIKHGLRNAKVILIPYYITNREMKALYSRANAYVSLSHAEGWGMGIYESAWYGKPIVATNYSGYLDFLTVENSYLVNCEMADVVPNDWEMNDLKGHQWANPNSESAVVQMRKVFDEYEEAKRKGAELKTKMHDNFSAAKITANFLDIINA